MITKEQAMKADLFHYGKCQRVEGPRGGVKIMTEVWRRNGRTQTWVRSPERFRVPVKYGLRGYSQITEEHAELFHVPEQCPAETKLMALSPNFYGFGGNEAEAKANLKKNGGDPSRCGLYRVPSDYWIDDFGSGHSMIGPGELISGTDHRITVKEKEERQ
jgi:hypothetical protein